ncbi:MAG: TetR/AcrR family transcriptional regulator [Caldimonas sp.]
MAINPARRDRRVARRRQEIMVIGKAMFLSQPYAQVSMEAIAEAADLSKATLYKYFSSKVNVYSAIILADAQMLSDRIHDAFDPGSSVLVNLPAMAHAYMSFFLEHPEYFEKLSWFYLPGRDRHLSDALIRQVSLRIESARAAIEECLEHAIRRKELQRVDAKAAAIVIYCQWLGLTYLAVAQGTAKGKLRVNYAELTEAACSQHLNGILSQIGTQDGPPARQRRQRADSVDRRDR